jgi:hypothetical protein
MATQTHSPAQIGFASVKLGAATVALAGLGLIAYGIMFLIRNFYGFTELGITPDLIGTTAEGLQRANPQLYHYISHLQVGISGFIIGLGIVVIALAWFGIRNGARWALWSAFLGPVVAVAIALPLHYPYGFDTIGHLGLIYLDGFTLLVGTVLAHNAISRS